MNAKRNVLPATATLLFGVAALALGSGCGGIGASGGVSPATFLLPGLGSVEPQPTPSATAEHVPDPTSTVAALASDSFR